MKFVKKKKKLEKKQRKVRKNMAERSFASQPHDYSNSNLLSSVTELKIELEKAISRIRQLDSDNVAVKESYEILKGDYIEMRKRYDDVNEVYLITLNEKLEAERQSEAFLEHVKVQLAEKTKEFELLREKFAPQDVDIIRLKIQEELEIPHRQNIAVKEAEIESLKEQIFICKREITRYISEQDLLVNNSKQDIARVKQEMESICNSYKDENNKLKDRGFAHDSDETIRKLKYRDMELQRVIEKLREEIVSCREEADNATIQLEQYKSVQEEAHAKLKASLITNESEKLATDQRVHLLVATIEKKDSQLRLLQSSNDEITHEITVIKKETTDRINKLEMLVKDLQEEKNDIKKRYENEVHDLNNNIEILRNQLLNREDLVRRSHRECMDYQCRMEAIECDIRRGYQQPLQDLNKKIVALELELMDARNSNRKLDSARHSAMEEERMEMDNLKSELTRIKKENEAITEKLRKREYTYESERIKYSSIKSETHAKLMHMQKTCSDKDDRMKELENKVALLTQNIETYQDVNNKLREDYTASIEAIKVESANQMRVVEKECIDKLEILKNRFKKSLTKEKKRLERDKALGL